MADPLRKRMQPARYRFGVRRPGCAPGRRRRGARLGGACSADWKDFHNAMEPKLKQTGASAKDIEATMELWFKGWNERRAAQK